MTATAFEEMEKKYADRHCGIPLSKAHHIKRAILKVYAHGPQGLAYTHKDQLNADLMEFIKT